MAANVLGMPLAAARELVRGLGAPAYRADQLYDCIFAGMRRVDTLASARPPSLSPLAGTAAEVAQWPRKLRDECGAGLGWDAGTVIREAVSRDGTRKWLVRTPTAPHATVETVFIPGGRGQHGTLCVSSQAGCSLSCTFCHTGTQGLQRNLSAADIVGQFALAARALRGSPAAQPASPQPFIRNVVFMGQGEPGYNWRAVRAAVTVLTEPRGIAMPPRCITISTSGVSPIISRVASELPPGVRLAISLHSANDELRSRLMGINRTYPLDGLMKACAEYVRLRAAQVTHGGGDDGDDSDDGGDEPAAEVPLTGRSSRHPSSLFAPQRNRGVARIRVTFEYVMLRGVNDEVAQAQELVRLLRRHLPLGAAHVNLIPWNAWPGATYTASTREAIAAFQAAIVAAGVPCHVRRTMGSDVMGACGQLRTEGARLGGLGENVGAASAAATASVSA